MAIVASAVPHVGCASGETLREMASSPHVRSTCTRSATARRPRRAASRPARAATRATIATSRPAVATVAQPRLGRDVARQAHGGDRRAVEAQRAAPMPRRAIVVARDVGGVEAERRVDRGDDAPASQRLGGRGAQQRRPAARPPMSTHAREGEARDQRANARASASASSLRSPNATSRCGSSAFVDRAPPQCLSSGCRESGIDAPARQRVDALRPRAARGWRCPSASAGTPGPGLQLVARLRRARRARRDATRRARGRRRRCRGARGRTACIDERAARARARRARARCRCGSCRATGRAAGPVVRRNG